MLVLETLLRAASDMKLEVPNAREEFGQILSSGDGTWAWDYLAGTVDLICGELRRQDEMSSQKIGPQLIAYVRSITATPAFRSSSSPACSTSPGPWFLRCLKIQQKSTY